MPFIERLLYFVASFLVFQTKGTHMTPEGKFKAELRRELGVRFPGCIVMQLDSQEIQGIPDLLILYQDKWATLECKKSKTASHRPNQDYYVNLMKDMSYSSFIFPENKEEVLSELQQTFGVRR